MSKLVRSREHKKLKSAYKRLIFTYHMKVKYKTNTFNPRITSLHLEWIKANAIQDKARKLNNNNKQYTKIVNEKIATRQLGPIESTLAA